ncbi:MAG: hypothetical protein VW518_02620, partial [Burkholderiaceae bacterium]
MVQRRNLMGMAVAAALAGCGFRLRGQVSLPFRQLLLTGVQGGVTQALRQTLSLNEVTVSEAGAANTPTPQWRLEISED